MRANQLKIGLVPLRGGILIRLQQAAEKQIWRGVASGPTPLWIAEPLNLSIQSGAAVAHSSFHWAHTCLGFSPLFRVCCQTGLCSEFNPKLKIRNSHSTFAVNTSSIRNGRRQPLAGSSCRRLSVQIGYEMPPNETRPS